MKEAENRAPCGKRAAAHGSGPEQEIKRTSPGNRRFAKQNEKRKRKKRNRSLIFEKYPSTISLVKVSDPSFLFFPLALSNGEANI